jgi:ribosomal protein S18 acetylase RimI-like enzyme
MENVVIRELGDDDRSWTEDALIKVWGATTVARKGALVDASDLPGFVAVVDGDRIGLVTYALRDDEIEVVTLQADRQGVGVGRALMDGVLAQAREKGAAKIWLVTTNDNARAIRFYELWGMDLVGSDAEALAASRRVKPEIPLTGHDGIPISYELEFVLRTIGPWTGSSTAQGIG